MSNSETTGADPMEAFILETLTATCWRRGGETHWTLEAAEQAAKQLIRRKLARAVRILQVDVHPEAVKVVPEPEGAAYKTGPFFSPRPSGGDSQNKE